jgi:hypothetical protein
MELVFGFGELSGHPVGVGRLRTASCKRDWTESQPYIALQNNHTIPYTICRLSFVWARLIKPQIREIRAYLLTRFAITISERLKAECGSFQVLTTRGSSHMSFSHHMARLFKSSMIVNRENIVR